MHSCGCVVCVSSCSLQGVQLCMHSTSDSAHLLLGAAYPERGTEPLVTGPPVWCWWCCAELSTWHGAPLAPIPESRVI